MAQDLVEKLCGHRTLSAAPREELEWLAAHGTLRELQPGSVLTAKGNRPEGLFVVLAGRLAMFVDRGSGPRKIMEWRAGDVTGVLPYSRVSAPPGDSVAQEVSEVLAVPGSDLQALAEQCHQTTAILVHAMLDRVRAFNASDLHDEKMVSLGKLSAGLAHELNNPAAAIERSAALLDGRLASFQAASLALAACRLSEQQLAVINRVRDACSAIGDSAVRSPIEQAEREETMEDWLGEHELDTSIAEALADTPVTMASLDTLAESIDGNALNAVLRSLSAGCAARMLAEEIKDAAMRISGIVIAVKGFTHMDQAPVAEPVDLARGLNNTVAVLRAKARSRSATVVINTEPDLPRVRGFAGELNQIWANLIDNALDAISDGGRIEVAAARERNKVAVRVIDNGAGIPAAMRERIFDPFFTTKPMGQGTGLGLDIVRRLVRHNDGEISVESEPGRTEFRVALPVADGDIR